jgi:transcriptional regulator with XRE-family HTH domain
MHSDMKIICKLRALMDSHGINQLQLAELTGLAPSTIGRLYRNQITRIDASTLIALAKYFDLKSVSEIIDFEIG